MGSLRRVTALVTALLLLHLTLADTSAACLTHVQGAGGPGGDHSEMSTATSIGYASDTNHSAVESSAKSTEVGVSAEWQRPTPERSGCAAHHTRGPCDSMAACGPAVFDTAIAGMSIVVIPAVRAIPSCVLTPPTRTTAPELPPPRL